MSIGVWAKDICPDNSSAANPAHTIRRIVTSMSPRPLMGNFWVIRTSLVANSPYERQGWNDAVGPDAVRDGRRSRRARGTMAIHLLRRWGQFSSASCMALAACVALALLQLPARGDDLVIHPTSYRTTKVDGLSIFYREAGPKDAPTLLFLHGLPSSSRMFEPLFARLSDRYHLVAPDYPGFGHSDWPDPKAFAYTFDHYAEIMNHFSEALGLSHYTLYLQDYGGPVGFRMIMAHPERVEALIVQDAVAHNEGLGANWKPRRAFWADRPANESTLRTNLLSLATTRTRHVGNDPNVEGYDPDLCTYDFDFFRHPAQPYF